MDSLIAVFRLHAPQQIQQAAHVLLLQMGTKAVDRRFRLALEFDVDAALPSAAQLQQIMRALQVVQHIPDGLADPTRREAKRFCLLPQLPQRD